MHTWLAGWSVDWYERRRYRLLLVSILVTRSYWIPKEENMSECSYIINRIFFDFINEMHPVTSTWSKDMGSADMHSLHNNHDCNENYQNILHENI